ncbi:gamma-glutamyltransferase [Paracnuella aquatica]|uniref:gamma-glutamyltransferase n=1 Tax=Paracnuella aquatica TaxID=2268757 RepID=UPI000DEEBC16|nr:gamma-glutamyltransferase [Paracnuella aquatica]RPD51919.1 gamma-glutamyltransferase [Paracnuella aquatica]
MRHLFLLSCCISLLGCTPRKAERASLPFNPYQYSIQKTVTAANGAVVSAHPLASMAGLHVMQTGGNAFDAAIATQLALAVVYPQAGNLGGGGFMVAQLAGGKLVSLDYREAAPAAAHRNMYLDSAGNAQTEKSRHGHLASGVPGTVAGLFESLQYAKLPMKTLLEPAIQLAAKGFVITAREARSLNALQPALQAYNTQPNALQKATPWKEGDTLVQQDLAATLMRIRDRGQKGFYEGETAQLIVAEMGRGSGIISENDLKNYKAKWRQPHRFQYRGHEVVSMPPPSSGGLLLHQMLHMVQPFPLQQWGFHAPQSVQAMVEAERRAYADRAQHMGDADFVTVPIEAITDSHYLRKKMQDFMPGKAGKSIATGEALAPQSEETTHISIIDKEGNAVAVTTTLNDAYGSKTVVGGAGFLLNDEMDDFSIKPGVPNMYGAIGGEANAIAPGKRMLSSMTPTLVLKDGKPYLVIGTPGGTTIPTSVFQTIINIIDFGLDATRAVNEPKFHHQWLPDEIAVEPTVPQSLLAALKNMGYTIRPRGPIGRTELIKVLPDGRFEAVADNRGDDSASGF